MSPTTPINKSITKINLTSKKEATTISHSIKKIKENTKIGKYSKNHNLSYIWVKLQQNIQMVRSRL